jgi:hypothetical protein
MAKKVSKMDGRKIALEAGAGVLTAAVLAAGAAYLLSDKKHQAKAKAWVAKAKKEVAKRVKTARSMSSEEYKHIVDTAVKRYGSMSDANKAELVHVAMELKDEWQRMKANAMKMAKMAQEARKPAVKAKKKTGARKVKKSAKRRTK